MSLFDLVNDIAKRSVVFREDDCPFSVSATQGDSNSRVLIIAGENASGKSLLFQVLAAWSRRDLGATPITVSIRERTGSGTHEMGGMRRAMMFGDETEQSTGTTSLRTTQTAWSTAQSWARDGKRPLVMFDEPDMGLSEGYCAAFGTFLGQGVSELAPEALGVVLVSHSRSLVRAFRDSLLAHGLGAPHFVWMGNPAQSLDFWLDHPEVHTVEELLALPQKERLGRRSTLKAIQEGAAERREKQEICPPETPATESGTRVQESAARPVRRRRQE